MTQLRSNYAEPEYKSGFKLKLSVRSYWMLSVLFQQTLLPVEINQDIAKNSLVSC